MILNQDVICFINMLEEFRIWYNRPMPVSSGYRTKKFNALVGGDKESLHLPARAADILYPDEYSKWSAERKLQFLVNIRVKWFEICSRYTLPSTGEQIKGSVIWEPTWFHLDTRTNKQLFLDYRGK